MAVLLALAVSVAAAQRAPLRSSIELTVVTATVRDADGKLVTGLPKEAFEVFEDGERVPIAQFTNERVPLGLGLLLDISDSMFGRRIKDAEAAVERFLVTLLDPKDAFFVMAFNHEARLLFGWKTEPGGRPRGAREAAAERAAPRSTTRSSRRCRSSTTGRASAPRSSSSPTAPIPPATSRCTSCGRRSCAATPSSTRSPSTRRSRRRSPRINVKTLNEITGQSGGRTEVVRATADLEPRRPASPRS